MNKLTITGIFLIAFSINTFAQQKKTTAPSPTTTPPTGAQKQTNAPVQKPVTPPAPKSIQSTSQPQAGAPASREPLASWNESASKKAIIDFVTKSTTRGTPEFIEFNDRIACFDDDGTLWGEQPNSIQLAFAIDRLKTNVSQHPEWKNTQPFKAALEDDMKAVLAGGDHVADQILNAANAGISPAEFEKIAEEWLKKAKHPKTGKHYNEMIYTPMLDLLNYLRANGYKTFIVSNGSVDFTRVWAEKAYRMPPNQIIGNTAKVKIEMKDGKTVMTRLAESNAMDEKDGKCINIQQFIGKRPVFCAGNADADYSMLQYTSTGPATHFALVLRHTDAEREYAYDRNSPIGDASKVLEDAAKNSWQVVDMKTDWKKIYPFTR